jgi:hypothetical protein
MMMVMTNERSDITSTDVLGKIIDNLISMQGFLERKKKDPRLFLQVQHYANIKWQNLSPC